MVTLFKKTLRFIWFVIKVVISIQIFCIAIFYYATKIEPHWVQVKEQPIYISNLPSSFEGFRIVQLSDLHGIAFPNRQLVNWVNELNPDIVAITGDVFDTGEKMPLDYINTVFDGIKSKYGVFFVMGNNDLYLGEDNVKEKMASLGITTLLNEKVTVGSGRQSLEIVGVKDPYSERADLSESLKGSKAPVKILLAHTPEIINEASAAKVDLVLVGHTHGGQINIPFIPRLVTNVRKGFEQYLSGLYRVGDSQMYVNRGLGMNDVYMRFFARPEITVFTLNKH